jgi:hypothetical protein
VEFSSGSNPHSLGMGALGGSSALEYDNGANALGPLVRCWIGDHQSALPLLLGKSGRPMGRATRQRFLRERNLLAFTRPRGPSPDSWGNYSLRGRLYTGNDQQFCDALYASEVQLRTRRRDPRVRYYPAGWRGPWKIKLRKPR